MCIDETFAHRKELADRATPGLWTGHQGAPHYVDGTLCGGDKFIAKCNLYLEPGRCEIVKQEEQRANTLHIAANSPEVILGDINEIERLHYKLNQVEAEADWLALVLANAGCGVPLTEYMNEDVNGMSPPDPEHWREAARKAVEVNNEDKN